MSLGKPKLRLLRRSFAQRFALGTSANSGLSFPIQITPSGRSTTIAVSVRILTAPLGLPLTRWYAWSSSLPMLELVRTSGSLRAGATTFLVPLGAQPSQRARAPSGSWTPKVSGCGLKSSSSASSLPRESPTRVGLRLQSLATSGCTSAPGAGSGMISTAELSYQASSAGCSR